MRYKVGDKVKIRSLEWYNENKDECGEVPAGNQHFVEDMKEHCGMQATITYASEYCYSIDLDEEQWSWTDEMFEEQLNVKTMEQKKTFEPFERVLTKNKENDAVWNCQLFSHYENDYVILVGGVAIDLDYTDIIPFAGNSHLVGTSDMPCEEVIVLYNDELIFTSDEIKYFEECHVQLRKFYCITEDRIVVKDGISRWKYCIQFSKFNPNDIEETKKHILRVKNGKLVRARV